MGRKLFPIFGWSLALSWITNSKLTFCCLDLSDFTKVLLKTYIIQIHTTSNEARHECKECWVRCKLKIWRKGLQLKYIYNSSRLAWTTHIDLELIIKYSLTVWWSYYFKPTEHNITANINIIMLTIKCRPFVWWLVPALRNPSLSKWHQTSVSFYSIQRWSITVHNRWSYLFISDCCQSHPSSMQYVHLQHAYACISDHTRSSCIRDRLHSIWGNLVLLLQVNYWLHGRWQSQSVKLSFPSGTATVKSCKWSRVFSATTGRGYTS